MRSSKKRKNDDQSLFDDIATSERLSREEQATNCRNDAVLATATVEVQPVKSNKIDSVALTTIRERRAPPNIFRNKQQQVPLKIPDLTPLHNDPVCLTYPKGLFVKGNEGALLGYFSEMLPPKCDSKCMPSQIIGAIYTATLRLLRDQILLETIPLKTVGTQMSKKILMEKQILLETVPSSHNQLRLAMSQMATSWYPNSTAIANGLRVYGISPSVFISSSSAVNGINSASLCEETCDEEMHLDQPPSELSPHTIKTMNSWFCMIQSAYDDKFLVRCGDSSIDIKDLVESYRLILIACSDKTVQEKCLYSSSKAANNILLRILDLLDEENANIANGSNSKSAGIASESSSVQHGVAAAVSVAVRSIINDPAFLEVDVMYMALSISQSDSRTSRFFTFFAETMLAVRFSDGSLLAKGSWMLPVCQNGEGKGEGEVEGEGVLLRMIMRGEYPSATSNHLSPFSKISAVMVGLSQSVKVMGGSPILNRKGALFAFVSLIHLMFTNSAEGWDAEECGQAVKRCLFFQNDLRKQKSTFSDIQDMISLTDYYWKTLSPVMK